MSQNEHVDNQVNYRIGKLQVENNSDIRRLKGVSEKDILRVQKYHEFYLTLKGVLHASAA
jgi:hypothetical protein